LIGWHFNTGDPRQPTRFAAASEYRKEYYREGILELLVANGSLSPALKKWESEHRRKPLPEPKMTLWLDELDPSKADQQGPVLVRQRQLTLRLAVDDFPLERIAALTWQLDRQAPQRFDDVSGTVHRADLSQAPWKKGEQRIRVVLRTQEEQPRQYIKDLT